MFLIMQKNTLQGGQSISLINLNYGYKLCTRLRGLVADRLVDSHAVVIVIVRYNLLVLRLLHKLAPGFPLVFPISMDPEVTAWEYKIPTAGYSLRWVKVVILYLK